jgi:hypothetical protein
MTANIVLRSADPAYDQSCTSADLRSAWRHYHRVTRQGALVTQAVAVEIWIGHGKAWMKKAEARLTK